MKLQDFKIGQTVYNVATGTTWKVVDINGSNVTVQRECVINGSVFNEYHRWVEIKKQ